MSGLIPVITLPMGAEIVIIVIGIAYTITSVFLQRKLSHPRKMREMQAKIKQLTDELNSLSKNKAPQEQLMAKQKEIMPLMGQSMKAQFKPMFVILPMFFIVYYLLLPALPPYIGVTDSKSNVQLLFFITVFVLGLVSSAVVLIYDRNKAKIEKLNAANTTQQQP